jgi:hypothetical protein
MLFCVPALLFFARHWPQCSFIANTDLLSESHRRDVKWDALTPTITGTHEFRIPYCLLVCTSSTKYHRNPPSVRHDASVKIWHSQFIL